LEASWIFIDPNYCSPCNSHPIAVGVRVLELHEGVHSTRLILGGEEWQQEHWLVPVATYDAAKYPICSKDSSKIALSVEQDVSNPVISIDKDGMVHALRAGNAVLISGKKGDMIHIHSNSSCSGRCPWSLTTPRVSGPSSAAAKDHGGSPHFPRRARRQMARSSNPSPRRPAATDEWASNASPTPNQPGAPWAIPYSLSPIPCLRPLQTKPRNSPNIRPRIAPNPVQSIASHFHLDISLVSRRRYAPFPRQRNAHEIHFLGE